MPNNQDEGYVGFSRPVVRWMLTNIRRIILDAWNPDETGYLDRMNPELEEFNWMGAVIRFLNTAAEILQYNLNDPVHRLLFASLLIEDDEQDNFNINDEI